jgi:hypothetical protein
LTSSLVHEPLVSLLAITRLLSGIYYHEFRLACLHYSPLAPVKQTLFPDLPLGKTSVP